MRSELHTPDSVSRFRSILYALAILFYFAVASRAQTLALQGPLTVKVGTVLAFTVEMQVPVPTIASVQWTFSATNLPNPPNGFAYTITSGNQAIAAGKGLTCTFSTTGATCTLVGANQTIIQNGTIASVQLVIPPTAPVGLAVNFVLSGITASDPHGVPVAIQPSGAGYAATIQAALPHGFQFEETPKGTIDGTNATFSLLFQPAPWASIAVYRNGLRLKRNLDYTLGGPNHMQISFVPAQVPNPGDVLLADYWY